MKLHRRVFSVALPAAFLCFNTPLADLHVHASAVHDGTAYHHGPASDHHDAGARLPGSDARVTAVDDDNTLILVRFSATGVSNIGVAG